MCQFQQIVEQFFKDFGRLVAKWPLLFILCSSTMALVFTAGFVYYARSIPTQGGAADEQFRLFLPENSESMRDLARLRSLFSVSARDAYDIFQSSYAYVILVPDSGDVLQPDVLKMTSEILDRIKRLKARVGWMEASWQVLCAKDASGACFEHPLLSFLNSSFFSEEDEAIQNRLASARHLLTYPTAKLGSHTIDNSLIFGSVSVNDLGEMLKAGALRIPFILQAGDSIERRMLNELWQREFVRVAGRLHFKNLSIFVSSSCSWRDEMDRNGRMLVSYLPALFAVLLIFSVVCCCATDWISSQPWLGFCGLLSAVLAVSSAFGVLFYFQYQYLQVVIIMPFLVLSVSADNAFLMLNAWRNSDGESNLERRMSSTIAQSAVSILITALTDGLSFAVGSASQFPAVRIFCTYCAVAVLFAFVYQMTFFAACLTFCGRRELAGRHCLTLKRVQKSAKTSKKRLHTSTTISVKFSTILASAMDNGFFKFSVILLYLAYLGSAIYGVTSSQLRLNMSNLVPYDSYVVAERRASDEHFSDYNGYAQAVVFTEKFEYHHAASRNLLLNLYDRLCRTEYSSNGEFWLSDFSQHLDATRASFTSEPDFLRAVRDFLDDPSHPAFQDDLVWSEDGDGISAIRMFIRLRRVGGGNQSVAVHTLRQRFSESRLRGFITDPLVFPLADQNDAVLGCVLQDAAVATGVIIAVVLIFLPKPLCAVWIGLSILSINAGVLGYLALWNVQVDVVSMMTTVMSVGLSVDYVAHVTYQYLITKRTSSYDRLTGALEHAGWSSVQSAVATVLGASTLAFVDSYMVRTFVKTVILVVSLGLLHGLLFLPIALSAFVPADQYLETNNYGRVRAYVSATVTRTARRRLSSYFMHRPPIAEVTPDPTGSSSLAWTSTASKSIPVYDSPPLVSDEAGVRQLTPELLSEVQIGRPGEVVEIVLKSRPLSNDISGDTSNGLLKTFQAD